MLELFFIWGVVALFCGALSLMGLVLRIPAAAKALAQLERVIFR